RAEGRLLHAPEPPRRGGDRGAPLPARRPARGEAPRRRPLVRARGHHGAHCDPALAPRRDAHPRYLRPGRRARDDRARAPGAPGRHPDPGRDAARPPRPPTPGVELRIVDERNAPVPAGTPGEVVVRSPAAMVRYWRDPEATAATIDADGWVHTGDVGFLDDAGYLHLRGRQSEMFIRGGFNVYPAEIEDLLARHPKVARAAVVGVPHDVFGEVGWAFVVPRAPSLSAPARICFFPRMPDHAGEAPALEAEARLFTRYLVGRPAPAELVDRYRAANAAIFTEPVAREDAALVAFARRHPWSVSL